MNKKSIAADCGKKKMALARHYFAGANTSTGFYNLFDQINDPSRQGTLYILKGGPGTGKSTLMKTVGRTFLELGEDVEYFYCSSDYQSLDGVRLPRVNIAIVDGTAPHVTEAQMPGIREKIINLGQCIGEDIKLYEKEITALLKKKKAYFDIAYSYIGAASKIYESSYEIFENDSTKIRPATAAKKTIELLQLEKTAKSTKLRSSRRLYLNAIANDGTVSLEDKNRFPKTITLSYNSYVSDMILRQIAEILTAAGHEITCFCELLSKTKLNAIFVKDAGTLIKSISLSPLEAQHGDGRFIGYLGEHNYPASLGKEKNDFIERNEKTIEELLKSAADALNLAKKMHKKVESFYIPKMDFDEINLMTNALIEEIKNLAGLNVEE